MMRHLPFPPARAATSPAAPAATTVVHVLNIACPVAKLRDFMSDTPQWLPWAMPTLQSVQPLPFGQWLLKTPRSLLKLRQGPAAATHTQEQQVVYELVVPGLGSFQALVHTKLTLRGCQLAVTLRKHRQMSLSAFTTSARHTLSGLQTLKLVLEQD